MSKKEKNEGVDLSALVESINKKYGKNKVIVVGVEPREKHPSIDSGSISLNWALNGGYAEGRIIEVFGDESSGKTTLALHAISSVQKAGGIAAFIDMEHSLNFDYAEDLGVNVKDLIFTQPDSGEECLAIAEELMKTGKVDFICFDSVAAMIPKAELEGDFGESKMGLHARMMSQGMRKLTGESSKKNVTLFFINQTREKIGIMFGDPTTTTGGKALKFYCTQRLHVSASTKQKNKDGEFFGQDINIKVIKNKVGSPHRKVKLRIIYGIGLDTMGEIVDIAVEIGVITKKGSFYSYGEHKLGQGYEALIETLQDNPELFEQIKKESNA